MQPTTASNPYGPSVPPVVATAPLAPTLLRPGPGTQAMDGIELTPSMFATAGHGAPALLPGVPAPRQAQARATTAPQSQAAPASRTDGCCDDRSNVYINCWAMDQCARALVSCWNSCGSCLGQGVEAMVDCSMKGCEAFAGCCVKSAKYCCDIITCDCGHTGKCCGGGCEGGGGGGVDLGSGGGGDLGGDGDCDCDC